MHNNGTSQVSPRRLILPDDRQVLSTIPHAPKQSFQIEIRPDAIVCHVAAGDDKIDLTLNPMTASQLGVNLISSAALLGSGLIPQPAPTTGEQPGPEPLTTDH